MPDYCWKGLNNKGEAQKGITFSLSPIKLQTYLLEKNIALLSCKEKRSLKSFLPTLTIQSRIDPKQIVTFFDHLALLLSSGIPIPQALSLVQHHLTSKILKLKVGKILEAIQSGSSLKNALEKQKPPFTPLMIYLVNSGEQSGALDIALKNTAIYLNKKLILSKKIKQASFLPALTLLLAVIICVGIFLFVIPQFESILLTTEQELPTSTKTILAISQFLQDEYNQVNLVSGVFIFFLSAKLLSYHEKTVSFLHKIILQVPVINKIVIHTNLLQFLQTLLLLLRTSNPLHQSISLASKTCTNMVLRKQLSSLATRVEQGMSLREALNELNSPYLPQSLQAAIAVGEQSEKLEVMIDKSIHFFQETLDGTIQTVLTVLQPILLLIVGLFIAFIMISIYLPIFQAAVPFS